MSNNDRVDSRWWMSAIVLLAVLVTAVGCPGRGPRSDNGSRGYSSSSRSVDDWASHTQNLPFVIGYEAGMSAAQKQGKPAMLFVTTTWCGWCKKLASESFRDPQVRRLLTDHFVCVIVDGDTETAAKRKFGVRGYPHVIFVTADGKKLSECQGYVPVENFRKIVEKAMQEA